MTSALPAAGDGRTADVIVVGAGPGGSATAAWLAKAGKDVVLLEKSVFPRDKICGDGLTPRAVRQLINLGLPMSETDGWAHNKGLRIIGGGMTLQLDWPDVASFPGHGMVRARADLDEVLARHAAASGATLLEGRNVAEPILDEQDRIIGVTAKVVDQRGRATGERETYYAPVVVAADGVSSRLSVKMGREKREDRPMAVAVRAYYETPRHDDEYLESHLELWSTTPKGEKILMPGYGWLFGLGDGRSNVGLGVLNTSEAFGRTDYKDVMRRWVETMPPEWGINADTMSGEITAAALPMAFNRQPLYDRGLMLVGDSGGMVNPFNGEGIDYALEAGHAAAETILQALARPTAADRERVLQSYVTRMKDMHGGYFRLGAQFAKIIGKPEIMRLATKYGLPRETLMKFMLKLMANLPEEKGGGVDDRLVRLLTRMAPNA
ncbi:geranylgeranyl reductase family protein [Janibacter cremeus]|uniref:geranylgeranyl reductase family protein n=1 Tax=Janibacter cremeus TaxID=1285192 RepID=UPI0023FA06A1|nr:geranylgeranyl reductase family protein [Janibacter cremeus]WEV77870.1 geranylgeranyl reductase family protein [Janibacter cremeus]